MVLISLFKWDDKRTCLDFFPVFNLNLKYKFCRKMRESASLRLSIQWPTDLQLVQCIRLQMFLTGVNNLFEWQLIQICCHRCATDDGTPVFVVISTLQIKTN